MWIKIRWLKAGRWNKQHRHLSAFCITQCSLQPDKPIKLYEPLRPSAPSNSWRQAFKCIRTTYLHVSMNIWAGLFTGLCLPREQPVESRMDSCDRWYCMLFLWRRVGRGCDNCVLNVGRNGHERCHPGRLRWWMFTLCWSNGWSQFWFFWRDFDWWVFWLARRRNGKIWLTG